MKKIVIEETGEGLVKLLGKRVTLFCLNYIYTGELVGVNDDCVLLQNGGIVYETGEFSASEWKDYQKIHCDLYIRIPMIESYGVMK